MRSLRATATALLLAAGLTLGLLPAAAHAAGPGVTLFVNTEPRPIEVPGSRFAGGLSIRSLLQQTGIDPGAVTFVNVTRADAGQVTLTQAELAARITDDGRTTRFVHGATRISATAATGPLQISVDGGDISVVASADRRRIEANESVTFSARVRFSPPGAQLSYEWDFNDGSAPVSGRVVSHVFSTAGDYRPRVTVTGTGGSSGRCATSCGGHDDVEVTVGEPPPPTAPAQTPGSGTGDPGAPGSGTGAGGGRGGSGGGSGTGSDPSGTSQPSAAKPKPKPKPKSKPKPKPKKPFGVTISGVLIEDPGTTISKLPTGTAAGAPKGGPKTAGAARERGGIELPLSGLLAMAFISFGALRERRGVRMPGA